MLCFYEERDRGSFRLKSIKYMCCTSASLSSSKSAYRPREGNNFYVLGFAARLGAFGGFWCEIAMLLASSVAVGVIPSAQPPAPSLPPLPAFVLTIAGCGRQTLCRPASDRMSIRCCSDFETLGISVCPEHHPRGKATQARRAVGLEGVTGVNDATLEDAALVCQSHGYRLCTAIELRFGAAELSGLL